MENNITQQMLRVSLNDGSGSGINSLFVECLLHIFDYLPEESVLCVGHVCVEWKMIATQSQRWHQAAKRGEALSKLEGQWIGLMAEIEGRLAKLRTVLLDTYRDRTEDIQRQIREKSEKKFSEVLQMFEPDIGTHLQYRLWLAKSFTEIYSLDCSTTRESYLRHQKAKTEILRHLISVQDLAKSDEITKIDDNPFVPDLDLSGVVLSTTSEMMDVLLQ